MPWKGCLFITNQRTLILASSSPRRQELIRLLQFPVHIVVSNVIENVDPALTPSETVETLSLLKAQAVYGFLTDQQTTVDGIIIGCDTIVLCEGLILGKPADTLDSLRMLKLLQGKTHQVLSGIACIDNITGKMAVAHRITRVSMKPLSTEQIQRYIATGEPADKAGSYGIQGLGAVLVDNIEGDYFNVMGLSLALLSDMLTEFDISVL